MSGAAERIIIMAEEQGRHRRELERIVVVGGSRRANMGLWLGFAIALLFLVAAVSLVLAGYETAGAIIGSVDVASLAAVFVVGRVSQQRERSQKAAKT